LSLTFLRFCWVWTFCVRLMLSYPDACLIIARVCPTFSKICTKFDADPLFGPSQNCTRPDTRLQIIICKQISMSTQLCEILYTDSQDMLVLSFTVASRYNTFCTNGSSNPGKWLLLQRPYIIIYEPPFLAKNYLQ
jgi:hypothetical protein